MTGAKLTRDDRAPTRSGARTGERERATPSGLAHLVAPADAIADRARLIAEIDRLGETHDDPAELRAAVLAELRRVQAEGRARVRSAAHEAPHAGLRIARSYAHVTDVVVAGALHLAWRWLHAVVAPTTGEQLSVVAVGGYGRGEMAPFSDVDLLFLIPYKKTAWAESVVETTLYLLWDLKLKVGQAVRTVSDCLRYARDDLTIRTNLLEARFLAGDAALFDELDARLWEELFERTASEFVEGKLAERDERHRRHGGSRYLLEPNVKESKGGLRDLQTLHWISRYLYRSRTAWDLVDRGIFERDEVERFAEAAKFIWAVRVHLHDLSGRAQEKLTFDRQLEIARRMGFEDHDGRQGVEHFMHAYFRHAKSVGDLTRIFSATLEAQHVKRRPGISSLLQTMSLRWSDPGSGPFVIRDGRLSVRDETVFEDDPVAILRLFHESARIDARIHPAALRLVTRSLDLVDADLRANPEATRLFREMLCDPDHAEWLLRLMNETEVLGRFVPEFGRAVAMMQFNMYHHYTVDEHTIQTIAICARIERGEEREAHPLASEIVKAGIDRLVLRTALLCHDLGKGDARDHSELGAEMAAVIAPRLGLDDAQSQMVVWLVRHHLAMSDYAQKRDIADPATVRDFANLVQSPERLRLLTVLTVCDIRGVGPGVWNNWKAQLIRTLHGDTRELLTGRPQATRRGRIEAAEAALGERLADWPEARRETELARHYPFYWLGLDTDTHQIFAELGAAIGPVGADAGQMATRFLPEPERDATKACLYMHDHPGLFSRMAGAFALAGANVVDARTYTTTDGMACSAFWIQDADGHPYEEDRLPKLKRAIERTLAGEVTPRTALRDRERVRPRDMSFRVPTRVQFDNEASELFTVIEVTARDRIGLLHALARTLTSLNINIFSAIIATYGESAVDVFYVKDLFGLKIDGAAKRRLIEERLKAAVDAIEPEGAGAPGRSRP